MQLDNIASTVKPGEIIGGAEATDLSKDHMLIERSDELKPNAFGREEKQAFLAELDERLKNEIYSYYTDQSISDTQSKRLEKIKLLWLEAQIDYWQGEIGAYNNAIATFEAEYAAYARDYNRNHNHKTGTPRFF